MEEKINELTESEVVSTNRSEFKAIVSKQAYSIGENVISFILSFSLGFFLIASFLFMFNSGLIFINFDSWGLLGFLIYIPLYPIILLFSVLLRIFFIELWRLICFRKLTITDKVLIENSILGLFKIKRSLDIREFMSNSHKKKKYDDFRLALKRFYEVYYAKLEITESQNVDIYKRLGLKKHKKPSMFWGLIKPLFLPSIIISLSILFFNIIIINNTIYRSGFKYTGVYTKYYGEHVKIDVSVVDGKEIKEHIYYKGEFKRVKYLNP